MNLRRFPRTFRWSFAVTFICALASGCGRAAYMRSHVDMLNTEKRLLEDEFYELETNYKYAVDDARRLHDENQTLRKRLGVSPTDSVIGSPAETVPAGDDFQAPNIDLGTPQQLPSPRKEIPNGKLPAGTFPAPPETKHDNSDDGAAYVPPDDMRVTHIVINPVLTAGHDFDRRPGDDGVSVVIEPRNADDVFVPRAGNVSVVALDPAKQGEAQRVARWDFDIKEALLRLRTGRFGRGLNFKLPWPEGRPENSKLHLFVRYVSDDGRVAEDDHEIVITREGEYSHRWTPKTVRPASEKNEIDPAASQRITFDGASRETPGGHSVLVRPERLPSPGGTSTGDAPPEGLSPPRRPVWQPFRPK